MGILRIDKFITSLSAAAHITPALTLKCTVSWISVVSYKIPSLWLFSNMLTTILNNISSMYYLHQIMNNCRIIYFISKYIYRYLFNACFIFRLLYFLNCWAFLNFMRWMHYCASSTELYCAFLFYLPAGCCRKYSLLSHVVLMSYLCLFLIHLLQDYNIFVGSCREALSLQAMPEYTEEKRGKSTEKTKYQCANYNQLLIIYYIYIIKTVSTILLPIIILLLITPYTYQVYFHQVSRNIRSYFFTIF